MNFRESKPRVVACDDEVAHEGDLEAASEGQAPNGGDERDADAGEAVPVGEEAGLFGLVVVVVVGVVVVVVVVEGV